MSAKRKSKVKPVVYTLLSFLLCIVLSALSVCIALQCTVMSRDYMLGVMGSHGYYSMIRDEMRSNLSALGSQSGLNDEIINRLVDSMDIQSAVTEYVNAVYENKTPFVKTTEFRQKLTNEIDQYITTNSIDRSSLSSAGISKLVDTAEQVYCDTIAFPASESIAKILRDTQEPLILLIALLTGAAIILIAVIYLTNHYKHRRYRYLSYAFAGSALVISVLPAIGLISGKIYQINILTRSLYSFVTNYVTGVLLSFLLFAAVMAVCFVLSFLMYRKTYLKALGNNV